MLATIGQIAVPVHDLERATVFYRDVLGLPFLFAAPGLAFFDCGGVRLMLSVPEHAEFQPPGSVLYYRVPEIRAAFDALSGRGVAFVDAPHRVARLPDHELWMAFFRDSEQNLLALMSEVRE